MQSSKEMQMHMEVNQENALGGKKGNLLEESKWNTDEKWSAKAMKE